jgi:hypothetical protein
MQSYEYSRVCVGVGVCMTISDAVIRIFAIDLAAVYVQSTVNRPPPAVVVAGVVSPPDPEIVAAFIISIYPAPAVVGFIYVCATQVADATARTPTTTTATVRE